MKTKREILEESQSLNEDLKETLLKTIETTLMIGGFIPVIGEVFDIVLIVFYCIRGQYLYAGLMFIALIPTVGDFIAKPLIRLLQGAGKSGKLALKNADEMVKFANSNPNFKKQYLKIGEHLNNSQLKQIISQVNKKSSKYGEKLQKSLSEHQSAISRLAARPVGIAKSVGKEVASGGKISTGVKKFFQDEKLSQYIAKKGMKPSNWVSNWWNVTYMGRMGRKNMIKNFILTNNMLNIFGLPSLSAFEDKMENDPNFRTQMANDPNFSNMVNQTTTPQDIESIEGGGENESKRSGIGDKMSLSFIKMLARGIA
jgi:hypothetical protein